MQDLAALEKDDISSLSLKGLDIKRFDKLLNSIKGDQVDTDPPTFYLSTTLECSHIVPYRRLQLLQAMRPELVALAGSATAPEQTFRWLRHAIAFGA